MKITVGKGEMTMCRKRSQNTQPHVQNNTIHTKPVLPKADGFNQLD